MAFKVNNSNEKFFNETKLYTGVSPMAVLAICPTLSELNSIGFNFEKEPVYTSVDPISNVKKVRIDVVFGHAQLKTKAAFFLEDKDRINKNGDKYEITNDFGQSTWAGSVAEAVEKTSTKNGKKWFKPDGARIAKVGEVALVNFIRDWANTNPDDAGKIDNFTALFNGNYKELQQYVNILKDNRIYTLATVKDGKYQGLYAGYFVRAQFSMDAAKKKFAQYLQGQKDAGYDLKESYSYEFKEYTGGVIEPDAETNQEGNINLDNQF